MLDDKIVINNLEVYAYHGYYSEENFLGQKFILDLICLVDLSKAGYSGILEDSINYAELLLDVKSFLKKDKYILLEQLIYSLADYILEKYYLVDRVELNIKKPNAPIDASFSSVELRINKERGDVFIAFGSNIGDKSNNIDRAIEMLGQLERTKIVKISDNYASKAVGIKDGEDFLNGVLQIETLLPPLVLLKKLQKIEDILGRDRSLRWSSRVIDLDILMYNDLINTRGKLILPHPSMYSRLFVLEPLKEIAPDLLHPIFHKPIYLLYEELKSKLNVNLK